MTPPDLELPPPEPQTPQTQPPAIGGLVSVITALFGVLLARNPDVRMLKALHDAWPQIHDALPYLITGVGSLYAWACHAPATLRKLFGKKPLPPAPSP